MKTRAKATAPVPAHDLASMAPPLAPPVPTSALVTNSSPVPTLHQTRSRGPAAPPVPLESIPTPSQSRSSLTIRLPKTSTPKVTFLTADNATAGSATAPVTSAALTTSPVRPPPEPASAASAPTPTPAPPAETPDQPIYTFPPPPPPPQTAPHPNRVDTSSPLSSPPPASADTNAVASFPLNGQLDSSPSRKPRARPPRHRARAIGPKEKGVRKLAAALAPPSPVTLVQPKPPTQPAIQNPFQPSPSHPTALPASASNEDAESDYAADAMDVDAEGISTAVASPSEPPKTMNRHRDANKKYRQRLKERIQNGDIDEIEAERRREKKRISARNSRARRKAMREAQEQEDSIMSNDTVLLSGPVAHPSGDTTPAPGDFLMYFPDTNPPAGSYSSTTFHEILAKANSASSDSASMTFQHYEPESASAPVRLPSTSILSAPAPPAPLPSATLEPATFPSAPVQSASLPPPSFPPASVPSVSLPHASFPSAPVPTVSLPPASFPSAPVPTVSLPPASFPSAPVPSVSLPPASFPSAPVPSVPVPSAPIPSVSLPSGHLPHDPPPIFKSRNFSDASIMTDPLPEPQKESEPPLDPLPPTLARHPHRQLTPERLLEFQANPLDLIDKAFLLIVPDADSSLGKLVLCRVIELRVSGTEHRFLVQFWGERTPSEIGVARMLEVLGGGYEIDPPAVGPPTENSGMTGRFFGALRSLTGF